MKVVDKPWFGKETPAAAGVSIVSPESAYLSGQLKTSNLDNLRRFETTFPLAPQVILETAQDKRQGYIDRGSLPTSEEKMDILFLEVMPKIFKKRYVQDWDATFHFEIEEAGQYTVEIKEGELTTTKGHIGEATTTVSAHEEVWRKIMRFEMLEDSNVFGDQLLEGWQDEESIDTELSDDQLEAIAGGKGGGCGAAASAVTACGADACGAAAGVATACGAAACAAAAGAYTACGGQACGAAVGYGAACGADACAAAACAGDVCGAAVGAGVCAGNVCGIDVLGGADIGPCAINVIPCVPGC